MWEFFDFVDGDGRNVIHEWLDGLAPSARKKVRQKLTARLDYLQATPVFALPYTRMLVGDCAGIFEIRFEVNNVQYRPLACYGPSGREVTILTGAIEVNDRFEPLSVPSTALERKALVMSNRRYVCPHDYT